MLIGAGVVFAWVFLWMLMVGAGFVFAIILAAFVAGLFLVAALIASRFTSSTGSEVLLTIFFFLGGGVALAAIAIGGCAVVMRGIH